MTTAELLADAFGRIREVVHEAVDGLTAEQLAFRPAGTGEAGRKANSIAWLIWHLTRIEDDHLAGAMGTEQVWTSGGWARRFALPFADHDTGYGHAPDDVAAVKTPAELLTGYQDAVHAQSLRLVSGITDADLDRIVDERWDPPVTLGVRLVSVISDSLQHAGQAAYLRGLIGC
jgi:Protein of unknown function (DUF664)